MAVRVGGLDGINARWLAINAWSEGNPSAIALHWGTWFRTSDVVQGTNRVLFGISNAGSFNPHLALLRWDGANAEMELLVNGTDLGSTTVTFATATAYYVQVSKTAGDEWTVSVNGTTEIGPSTQSIGANCDDLGFGCFYNNSDPCDPDCDFANMMIWNAVKNHSTINDDVAPWLTAQDTVGLVNHYRFATGALATDDRSNDTLVLSPNDGDEDAPVFIADFGITGETPPASGYPEELFGSQRRRNEALIIR